MNTSSIIEAIDKEISKLQEARSILSSTSASTPSAPIKSGRRGRPKGSKNGVKSAPVAAAPQATTKRVLSEEGRARISAALKKRHAAKKRAAKKEAAETA